MAMGPTPKCHFVLGFPSGNFEIPKIGTPATLETHNFVCKPPYNRSLKIQESIGILIPKWDLI
jgi:hypothetical protein